MLRKSGEVLGDSQWRGDSLAMEIVVALHADAALPAACAIRVVWLFREGMARGDVALRYAQK